MTVNIYHYQLFIVMCFVYVLIALFDVHARRIDKNT